MQQNLRLKICYYMAAVSKSGNPQWTLYENWLISGNDILFISNFLYLKSVHVCTCVFEVLNLYTHSLMFHHCGIQAKSFQRKK